MCVHVHVVYCQDTAPLQQLLHVCEMADAIGSDMRELMIRQFCGAQMKDFKKVFKDLTSVRYPPHACLHSR